MPQDDRQAIFDNLKGINEQILKITQITAGHAMVIKVLGAAIGIIFTAIGSVLLSWFVEAIKK